MVEQPKCMVGGWGRSGISQKTGGSKDETKMHFQSQEVGIPEGVEKCEFEKGVTRFVAKILCDFFFFFPCQITVGSNSGKKKID